MRALLLALFALLISAPVQAQQAGWLVSHKERAGAPKGARAWDITYLTTDGTGRTHEVTGVVIAPTGPASRLGRPVLAWAHGTWGVASKCAPSLGSNFFDATPGLADAIKRGYVVVATDYTGLNSNLVHPYLIGDQAARDVLDSVRAVQGLGETGANKRFAVWGESQGGHAALFTGQFAQSYAPELELFGVAAAAPPTELLDNLTGGSDPSIRAFMTAYTAHSWSQVYNIPLSSLGNKATGDLINRLAKNNCVTLTSKPKLSMAIGVLILRRQLKGVDIGRIEPWASIARDNSVSPRPYGVPFLIAQNEGDVIVSPSVTRHFAKALCSNGGTVRYISFNAKGGHPTSAKDTAHETLDWIDARLRGDPAPNNCRNI